VSRVAASGNARDRSKGFLDCGSLLDSHCNLGVGKVRGGAGPGVSRVATTRDTRDRGEGLNWSSLSVGEVGGRTRARVGRVAATWDLSLGRLSQRCSGTGAVLAVASVVLAYASGKGAAASNLGGSSSDAGLVSILALIAASEGSSRGSRGQSQSDNDVVDHVDE
jgi:hypothetical protein